MRLFIALELSEAVGKQLGLLIDQLNTDAAKVRWVDPGDIHLTLKFLGEVHDRDVSGVCEATAEVAGKLGPIEFDVSGVGAFPNVHGPRVIWAGLSNISESLIAVREMLEVRLAESGFPPEGRRFTPHLTVGRVKGVRDRAALERRIADYADWSADEPQYCDEVVVLSSELRREGPIYTVVHRAKLAG